MEPDFDKLNFYSNVNYMKRSDKSGESTISSSEKSVTHGLGYEPQFLHYADVDNDGYIWYGGERVNEYTESTSGGGSAPPRVDAWITDTTLTLSPFNISSARPIYWLIYLDYEA